MIELSLGTSYCLIGETAIFLDLLQDRYWAAPANALHRADAIVALSKRGLLTGSGELGSTVKPVAVPKANTVLVVPKGASGAFACLGASLAMIRAAMRLKWGAPGTAIALPQRQHEAQCSPPASRSKVEDILRSFRLIDRFFDQNRACLTRSLAIRDILSREGIATTLVIGVRLHPFSAHAWLQINDSVINDTVDRVRLYQPVASF